MTSSIRRRWNAFFAEYRDYLSGGVKLSEYEEQEARWRRTSLYSFVILIMGVGLPIWWHTTTPYRATLPYFDEETIDRLRSVTTPHLRPHEKGGEAGVWRRVPQFPNYQLHVVFIHGSGWERKQGAPAEESLIRHLNHFSEAIDGSIHLDITTEHLFDFDYFDTSSNSGKYVFVGTSNVSRLASEIDRLTTPPAGYAPLLKLATFLDDGRRPQRIRFVDNDRANTQELIVAGWGGMLVESERSSASIGRLKASAQAVLSTLMGISRSEQPTDDASMSSRRVEELHDRHSRDLWAENLNQTVHFINSLHELKEKITDMVISDEVGKLAWTSHAHFFSALNSFVKEGRIDSIASAKARILSSRAVTHSSLLEYLNFPQDQKYGVYVPLFVPLLMQIAFPIFGLTYFALRHRKNDRKGVKND